MHHGDLGVSLVVGRPERTELRKIMVTDISQKITSIFIVTLVFSIFIISASLRIRNSWIILHTPNQSTNLIRYKKLDLIFSSIFLFATLFSFVISLTNVGH